MTASPTLGSPLLLYGRMLTATASWRQVLTATATVTLMTLTVTTPPSRFPEAIPTRIPPTATPTTRAARM